MGGGGLPFHTGFQTFKASLLLNCRDLVRIHQVFWTLIVLIKWTEVYEALKFSTAEFIKYKYPNKGFFFFYI